MKSQNQVIDAISLERELEAIAPLVQTGLSRVGGPSDRVIRAIHDEAVARALTQRRQWTPLFRVVAAAASLLILLGGALQFHFARQAGVQAQTLQLVLHIGAPHAVAGPVDGTTELANRLLNIQGLDEETFFTPVETEALSL
jgi:hypothetical protein